MSDFEQGIYVTIMGMGLVFASLGLLMLIIAVLGRIFREQPAPPARPAAIGFPPAPPPEPDTRDEIVAAIAVALAVLRQRRPGPKPPETTVVTFAPSTGAWRATGRLS